MARGDPQRSFAPLSPTYRSPDRDAAVADPGLVDERVRASTRTARRAAARAGITVTLLSDLAAIRLAAELFAEVWATDPREPMPVELLRAMAHTDNYVAAAWVGEEMVGASAAFFGQDQSSWILHSHITGVLPGVQRSGTGFALKQHQRAWAVERGVDEITWTFDPLIRRNAWFNLVKLGAVATSYHRDFYGPIDDGINAGEASDRCLVSWHLWEPNVVAAAEGSWSDTGEADRLFDGSAGLLEEDANGDPVALEEYRLGDEGPWRCRIPADMEALRRSNPDRSHLWRHALRDTMGVAMGDGFVARAITRNGWYLLTRPPREEAAG